MLRNALTTLQSIGLKNIFTFAALALLSAPVVAQQKPVQVVPQEEKAGLELVPPTPREFSPATVAPLTDAREIGSGYYSNAATDDTVLENELVRFIFGAAPEDSPVVNEQGYIINRRGSLIDVSTGISGTEGFHMFMPTVTPFGRYTLVVDSITSSEEANGKASVVVQAHDRGRPELTVRTEYMMFKDSPGVLVTTTVTNGGDEPAPNVVVGDFVMWGSMTAFVPGKGWITNMSHMAENVEFVFGRHDNQWILIAPDSGTFDQVVIRNEAMLLSYADQSDMVPGESRLYRRWIMVGDHDPALLYSAVLQRRQDVDTGTLVGRVIEREQAPDGSMVDKAPVEDANIYIAPLTRSEWSDAEKARANLPYLIARTNERGQFQSLLPVGSYRVFPSTGDRIAPKPNYASRIEKGKVDGIDFGTSRPSRLLYKIVDAETGEPMPGKLTVEPLRGTIEVDFGPFGEIRSGNTILSSHGAGIVNLAPGNYRITASRGPEYHTTEHRVTIRTIEDVEQVFELRRAFDTPGWVSADIGVRTNATPNVRVGQDTRVISGVAEGLDWMVTGDSGTATDLSSVVDRLALNSEIKLSPGYRRSGRKSPYAGDFLLFPTNICSTGPNPDFSAIANASTGTEIIDAMRAICPNGVILLSRGTWPDVGYLTLQGYNRETGRLPEGDYSKDFDAFQIWEGKRQGVINEDYMTYHALLRDGLRTTAFGNTNSRGTWMAEVGYPRVYIKSSSDNPAELNPEELALNIKKGLVSVTNGPFINVKVNDKPMGSLVTDTDGTVDVDLEVFAANWVPISSISVNLNGRFVRKILLNPATLDRQAGKLYPSAERPEEGRLEIPVSKDSVLDIVVEGTLENSMDPVNPFNAFTRDPYPSGQYTYALSAPIFIDADGNGKLDLEKLPPLQPEDREEPQDPPI